MANSYNLTCSAYNTFWYIHTDESTESEVKLSVSLKKLKPQEIGNLNLKPFFK